MSLIESCVSAVIVSIVTVIALPPLVKSLDAYVLKSVAADVATRLHTARIRAISRNTDCRLRTTSPVSYAVECQDPVWTLVESIVLPLGFTVSANARPEFHRLGNVAPTATITVSNKDGRVKTVVVNTGGRIRIN